jgi:NADH-quinone oxidoreductase subunit M
MSKKNIFVQFSIYNLIGAILLLIATVLICELKKSNIPLNTVGNINIGGIKEYIVWFSIFLAFISRLPIWPFHYWISSISAGIKNPLVFIISNTIPLMGLYGFMRYWPNTLPETIAKYSTIFETICIITMLFIALISLSNKDMRYKLYAYSTIYYLLYLIGIFMPTNTLKQNIGYSLFSYIIIITVLSFLISHIETQKKKLDIYSSAGVLCYMPKTSKCISLFILAGIGLPITPLFWNNFIIISEIFNHNLILGIFVMLSLIVVGIALLEELYKQKDKTYATSSCVLEMDIPNFHFIIYIIC